MRIEQLDAIVVGAGQAGPALCEKLSKEGYKTAIIERKYFGGTCVNYGCIPTKALIANARAVHLARRGAEFGFSCDSIKVDMKKIKDRKDRIMLESRVGVENWLKNQKNLEVIQGDAKFHDNNIIAVNDRLLTAKKIFLNVGGRAFVPPIPGLGEVEYHDNVSIMELEKIPDHLAIIGGSYIGLEFAQMMRRFGSQVTVIERSARLLPREDVDVSDEILKILEKEGIKFVLGAGVQKVSKSVTDEKILNIKIENGKIFDLPCSDILVAVGRTPNTNSLSLERTGVETDERGFIKVNDECLTTNNRIWALGDCNGKGAFTHTAWNDYEIVSANIFSNEKRKISDRIMCYSLFIDPPLARIGITETQAKGLSEDVLVAKMNMSRIGRARESGETQGFMKVLVSAKTNLILGATIFGFNGDEVIHCLLDIMAAKQPYTTITKTVHIHPTVSELIPTLLQQLAPLR